MTFVSFFKFILFLQVPFWFAIHFHITLSFKHDIFKLLRCCIICQWLYCFVLFFRILHLKIFILIFSVACHIYLSDVKWYQVSIGISVSVSQLQCWMSPQCLSCVRWAFLSKPARRLYITRGTPASMLPWTGWWGIWMMQVHLLIYPKKYCKLKKP